MKAPEDPKGRQFLQLNRYRRERTLVHVYLLSGTRFSGRIKSFDVHTLLLETQQSEMAIYTHAISTIEVAGPRGRKPASAARRFDGPAAQYPARRQGLAPPRFEDDAPGWGEAEQTSAESRPSAPAPMPTVTVLRRRSRLLPRD